MKKCKYFIFTVLLFLFACGSVYAEKKCYYCATTNTSSWNDSKPNISCSSGWQVINATERICKNSIPYSKAMCCYSLYSNTATYIVEGYCDGDYVAQIDAITKKSDCTNDNASSYYFEYFGCKYSNVSECKSLTGASDCGFDGKRCIGPKCTASLYSDGVLYDTRTCVINVNDNYDNCTSSYGYFSKGNFPTPTKSGYTFKGWVSQKDGDRVYKYDELYSDERYDADWVINHTEVTPETPIINPEPSVEPGEEEKEDGTTVNFDVNYVIKAGLVDYYYIKYDLNGGKFIDGTTSRTEVVRGDKPVGVLKTNPIKEGYKFVEWQLNGATFDFNKTVDSYKSEMSDTTLTLKAVYEEFEDYGNYVCPSGYSVLDVSTQSCYKVLNPDNKNTYNYTTYEYSNTGNGVLWCFSYYTGKCADGSTAINCSTESNRFILTGSTDISLDNAYAGTGGQSLVQGVKMTASGKNGAKYEGYDDQDWWVSENTCMQGKPCYQDSLWRDNNSCKISYGAIIYASTDATLLNADSSDYIDTTDADSSDYVDKTDNEISEPPVTGDVLIYVAVAFALGAIGYTVYYFKKRKEQESTVLCQIVGINKKS